MRKYSLKEYGKVIKLKDKELGSLRISNLLNIPRPTIEGWINQGRKPYYFSEKRIKACTSKENIKRLIKISKTSQPIAVAKARIVNTKPIKNLEITDELSYILGVINGDGHVSQRRIILSAIDKDFVQTFQKHLEKWTCYKTRLYSRLIKLDNKIKKRKLQWVCYLDSIEIEKFVKNFDYNKIDQDSYKINFLRGFFDSEGSFSKDYELIVYNTNYNKLKRVSNYLSDLGLNSRIKGYTVKNINYKPISYYYLKVIGESRYSFYQKIGFNIHRKQRRLINWVQTIGQKKYGGENDRKTKNRKI